MSWDYRFYRRVQVCFANIPSKQILQETKLYILLISETQVVCGDHDSQQSTCSNPLQVAFVPLDNLYFPVQPSTG